MTSRYSGWNRHRPPRIGDIVYPWGNPSRAVILRIDRSASPSPIYRIEFIDDDVATIRWWMKILMFPRGAILELAEEAIRGHPQRKTW